jgi:hypothetical protein
MYVYMYILLQVLEVAALLPVAPVAGAAGLAGEQHVLRPHVGGIYN